MYNLFKKTFFIYDQKVHRRCTFFNTSYKEILTYNVLTHDQHVTDSNLVLFISQSVLESYSIDDSKVNIFEINYSPDMNEIESYMSEITGGKTVPRIFIGGQFIGGSDNLVSLHSSKKLAEILNKSGAL